ncbi:MAG: hypothetical protein QG568_23 [Patescibacteria group bacterium]|nr:hypothetical protein [Patescibacteria group bacterium]
MEIDSTYFNNRKEKARSTFFAQKSIYNSYFKCHIIFNSDGFHHLQFSSRTERTKQEQLYKFSLLSLGIEIIKKSGTIQEYRKILSPVGKKNQNGETAMKYIEYWGMVAIIGEKQIKVRTILRRVGTGNITFWSIMLDGKIKNGYQKQFSEGIEDE